ncbi:hypothetical protein AVEN_191238-1 [Araneus ventricosus]|uniref:Uncharacterized protein n=1 Tax=Araneus ventricosus TaxID=182803 RepID=A0A4Y2GAU7_ARAVE|nr:hypothetical protein AVEN_191238-1 [Araneus ventricosus]
MVGGLYAKIVDIYEILDEIRPRNVYLPVRVHVKFLHPGNWTSEIHCVSKVARMTRPNRGRMLPRRLSFVIPFFKLWSNLYFTSFAVTSIVSNYFMDSSFLYVEKSRTIRPRRYIQTAQGPQTTR